MSSRYFQAAKDGDIKTFRKAIRKGMKVNAVDEDNNGDTALNIAARHGHTGIVEELLSLRAKTDLTNADGDTALIIAAREGHIKIVSELLYRTNVNLTNNNGRTALMEAISRRRTLVVKSLLLQSVIDQKDNDGDTALIIAVKTRHAYIVQQLLSARANVNEINKYGLTALMEATSRGETVIVTELLNCGADVNLQDHVFFTALILAAMNGHTEIVMKLLNSGVNVDQVNKIGRSALMEAILRQKTDVVKELLSRGANVHLEDSRGNTALIFAVKEGHTDIVRDVLKSGVIDQTHQIVERNETVLDYARKRGHFDIVHLLEETVRKLPVTTQSTLRRPEELPVTTQSTLRPPSDLKTTEKCKTVTSEEMSGRLYRNTQDISSPPSEYRLFKNPSYPGVTFFDEPQEKVLSSRGGQANFDNGLEIAVSNQSASKETTAAIKVQSSFAPKDVFVIPPGIRSASPSYLIRRSSSESFGDVTLTLEHHVNVKTREDAKDLLFLHADSTPDSKSQYEYKQVQEGKSEFLPGENTGKLTTKHFSHKFFKVGLRKRVKKLFVGSKLSEVCTSEDPPNQTNSEPSSPDLNCYTLRVYRSPLQTSGDRIAILGVSLYGRLYRKFLEKLDTVVIPRDYPEVSSKAVDRTTVEPLCFKELHTRLEVFSSEGWMVEPDKTMISKRGVDLPESDNFRPEELNNYPPRIVCRFYPDGHTPPRTTCILSFTGFDEEVKIYVPLKAFQAQRQVNTSMLQEATENLRSTTIRMKETQLTLAVKTIVSLMERMNTALCSTPSLGDLAANTDSIEVEVQALLSVSRRVAEECFVQSIKLDIEANLSKIQALSHQLCKVTEVKLKYCQDQSEETAALNDLVSSGAYFLKAVICLLNTVQTLQEISMKKRHEQVEKALEMSRNGSSNLKQENIGYNVLAQCGEKIVGEFTKDPKTLALQLLAKNFISHHVLEETNELNETNSDKGRRLYTAVLGRVKQHPQRYAEFISILEGCRTVLYQDLLKELGKTYYKLGMPKLEEM